MSNTDIDIISNISYDDTLSTLNNDKTENKTYNCIRCGYSTTYKHSFKKHIIRKYICKPTKSSATRQQIHDDMILQLNESLYYCTYCNKSFTRIDNMNRHMKKSCKSNTISLLNNNNNTIIINGDIIINKPTINILNNVRSIGKEYDGHIYDLDFNKVMGKKCDINTILNNSIPQLTNMIHFNEKHVHNYNIRALKKDK